MARIQDFIYLTNTCVEKYVTGKKLKPRPNFEKDLSNKKEGYGVYAKEITRIYITEKFDPLDKY